MLFLFVFVMTLGVRAYNIVPKKELHRRVWVGPMA